MDPVATLTFVDAFGDDQKSCVEASSCTFSLAYPDQRGLPVRLTLGGETVTNAAATPIYFVIKAS